MLSMVWHRTNKKILNNNANTLYCYPLTWVEEEEKKEFLTRPQVPFHFVGLHIAAMPFFKKSLVIFFELFHSAMPLHSLFRMCVFHGVVQWHNAVWLCCFTFCAFPNTSWHFVCFSDFDWVLTFHNTSTPIISLAILLLRYSALWNPFTAPCRRHSFCSGLPDCAFNLNWQSSYCFLFPLFGFNFFLRMSYSF